MVHLEAEWKPSDPALLAEYEDLVCRANGHTHPKTRRGYLDCFLAFLATPEETAV